MITNWKNLHLKRWLSALLAAALLFALPCLPVKAESAAPLNEAAIQALNGDKAGIYSHDGRVTFVDGACTDQPVRSMEDAAAIVDAMLPMIGGDARTQFAPWRSFQDPGGNRYYVFYQIYAETTVSGGAVKVVTDPDGRMLGLVASLETALPEGAASEGISASRAEEIVLNRLAEEKQQADLVEGQTAKIVLPVNRELDPESEEEKEESRFVWAVYTGNPDSSAGKSDLPYLAHYVDMTGQYLYNLPTMMPGDEAGASGYNAAYVFDFMEPAEYTGAVTLSDGTQQEITVTLMQDTRTGMYYLGNPERRIVVADCWEFLYNHGRVKLEASADNTGWDNTCLLTLYNYCRAWDYYHAIGWDSGDGLGTPIIVLKDFCDKDHNPIDNAAYAGHYMGWQVFLSSSANDFSQCLDVLAHEYTHSVTQSVTTWNAYLNDYGAINEALSDIQGQICDMMAGATEDTTWIIADNSKEQVRSLSDPHKYDQPEFVWDLHYQPKVKTPTEMNDRGGIHTNSSLLGKIAWSLCESGGMTLEEARIFWFAASCAMVPGTDYVQLSELLPWVMRIQGMDKYLPALEAAMDATRIRTDEMPEVLDEDRALVSLTLPDLESLTDGHWAMYLLSADYHGLFRRFLDMLGSLDVNGQALDELLDIVLPSEPAEQSGEADPAVPQRDTTDGLSDWIEKYLHDFLYMGNSAAGQDGRTIRMVTRPGLTLPILLRMETKDGATLDSGGLAVFFNGKWMDVGSFMKTVTEVTSTMSQEEMEAWVNERMDEVLPKDGMDLFGRLLEIILDPGTALKKFFLDVKPGSVTEIPATGLESIRNIDMEGMSFDAMLSTPAPSQEAAPEAVAGPTAEPASEPASDVTPESSPEPAAEPAVAA